MRGTPAQARVPRGRIAARDGRTMAMDDGGNRAQEWALLGITSLVKPEEEYLNTFKIFNCSFQLKNMTPTKKRMERCDM